VVVGGGVVVVVVVCGVVVVSDHGQFHTHWSRDSSKNVPGEQDIMFGIPLEHLTKSWQSPGHA